MKAMQLIVGLSLFTLSLQLAAATTLPRPSALKPAIKFWTRIYTEVDTSGGLIHDAENLEVVYRVARFPSNIGYRARSKKVKAIKKRIKQDLLQLAKGRRKGLGKRQRRVLDAWPQGVSNRTLRRAAKNVRFQLGQANKYKAGLIRSGKWRKFIQDTFKRYNVPRQIALLPHVESSFNPDAYSKVGAAGLWQFTRGTGRRYMRVDHIVDERLDPFKATKAAAALLTHNYSVTGTWPLAITSYNHGSAGMRRATKKLGTTDMAYIIKHYKSRTFGFASRNFYVALLAAIDADKYSRKYFGKVRKMQAISPTIFKIPQYVPAKTLCKALGINLASFKSVNPALRPSVWSGNKHIPKNFQLYLPKPLQNKPVQTALASIASQYRFDRQKRDRTYRVRRGNTLSQIARRFRVKVRDIMGLNNLRSARRIRVGQVLRLPQRRGTQQPIQIAKTKKRLKVAMATKKRATQSANKSRSKKPFTGKTYKVRKGDSLSKISKRFNVTQKSLLALNNINSRQPIYAGQTLRIKTRRGKSATRIVAVNKGPFKGQTYKVQRGDSLAKIAKRLGVKERQLLALNDLRNRHRIYVGQILRINPKPKQRLAATASAEQVAKALHTAKSVATPIVVAMRETVTTTDVTDTTPVVVTPTGTTASAALETPVTDIANPQKANKQNTLHPIDNEDAQLTTTKPAQKPADTVAMSGKPAQSIAITNSEEPALGIVQAADQPAINSEVEQIKLDQEQIARLEAAEPASESEAAAVSPGMPAAAAHAPMAADPSDYEVADNKTIEIQAEETLGHIAEWLDIRASQLRRINKLRFGRPMVIGKRLKLDFSKTKPDLFVQRRIAYHRGIQEDFFTQYHIDGTKKYTVRRGETLWYLTNKKFGIPVWLLRQHNPDIDFQNLLPKMKITIPNIKETEKPEQQNQPAAA